MAAARPALPGPIQEDDEEAAAPLLQPPLFRKSLHRRSAGPMGYAQAAPDESDVLPILHPEDDHAHSARSQHTAASSAHGGDRGSAANLFHLVGADDGGGVRSVILQNLSSHFLKIDPRRFKGLNALPYQERSSVLGLPILDPTISFYLFWTILLLVVDATYTAFIVPLTLAFDISSSASPRVISSVGLVIDIITGLIFLANLALGFQVGYILQSGSRRLRVRDGPLVARLYVSSYHFWLDAVACVPFFFQLATLAFITHDESTVLELQGLRLIRLIRVAFLVRRIFLGSFTSSFAISGLSPLAIHILQMIYLILFIVNSLACMLLGAGRSRSYDAPTWLMAAGGPDDPDLRDASAPRQYLAAVYFTTTTISTTGYGDIGPKSSLEQALCIVVQFAGVLFFAFITSNFTQALSHASQSFRTTEEYRQRMEALNKWFRKTRLPTMVENRIRSFYDRSWKKGTAVEDASLIGDLPPFLRSEVAQHALAKLLKRVDSFRHLDNFTVESVAAMADFLKIPAGHDVYHQGEPSNSLFLLTEGEVVVVENGTTTSVIEAPAILGEISLLWLILDTQRPRTRTYRAFTNGVSLWRIETESVGHLLESQPNTLLALIKGIREHIARKGPLFYPSIGLDMRELGHLETQVVDRLNAGALSQVGVAPMRSSHRDESLEALGPPLASDSEDESEPGTGGFPASGGPRRKGVKAARGIVAKLQRASANFGFLHGNGRLGIGRRSAVPSDLSSREGQGKSVARKSGGASASGPFPTLSPRSSALGRRSLKSHRRARSEVPSGLDSADLVAPAATEATTTATATMTTHRPRSRPGTPVGLLVEHPPRLTLSPIRSAAAGMYPAPIGILARVSATPGQPIKALGATQPRPSAQAVGRQVQGALAAGSSSTDAGPGPGPTAAATVGLAPGSRGADRAPMLSQAQQAQIAQLASDVAEVKALLQRLLHGPGPAPGNLPAESNGQG